MADQNQNPLLPTVDEDEQFMSSETFMAADTALDWDALVTRGNANQSKQAMTKWERDSLYVKFDPLVSSRRDPVDRSSFVFKAPLPSLKQQNAVNSTFLVQTVDNPPSPVQGNAGPSPPPEAVETPSPPPPNIIEKPPPQIVVNPSTPPQNAESPAPSPSRVEDVVSSPMGREALSSPQKIEACAAPPNEPTNAETTPQTTENATSPLKVVENRSSLSGELENSETPPRNSESCAHSPQNLENVTPPSQKLVHSATPSPNTGNATSPIINVENRASPMHNVDNSVTPPPQMKNVTPTSKQAENCTSLQEVENSASPFQPPPQQRGESPPKDVDNVSLLDETNHAATLQDILMLDEESPPDTNSCVNSQPQSPNGDGDGDADCSLNSSATIDLDDINNTVICGRSTSPLSEHKLAIAVFEEKKKQKLKQLSRMQLVLQDNVDDFAKQNQRHHKAIEERDVTIDERNEALMELSKAESRFTDMLMLYEKVKNITTKVEQNCVILQKREEFLAQTLKKREARQQANHDLCAATMEKMQRDFDSKIKEKETENVKFSAKIRMCDMKIAKLEGEITQVDRESESLRKLCEDLMVN